MGVYYKPPSRMLGDLLGAALLFAGGLITFVGLMWAGKWPLGGVIMLLVVAFVIQFVATIITESRTTTTSIWTISLIIPLWLLLWATINITSAELSPNGWVLVALSVPVYAVGVIGGTIGTKMYQQQETARIAAARAAMDLVSSASDKNDKPIPGTQNALDDDLDEQLSKRSDDTTIYNSKDFARPVGANPAPEKPSGPAAANPKSTIPKPPTNPPARR